MKGKIYDHGKLKGKGILMPFCFLLILFFFSFSWDPGFIILGKNNIHSIGLQMNF